MSEAELRDRIDNGFSRVYEKLDVLRETQGELREEIVKIQSSCEPCREIVRQHETDLRGTNGDGIRTRLALAEQEIVRVAEMQERLGDPAKRSKRAQQTSIGAIVAAVGTVLWQLISLMFGDGK